MVALAVAGLALIPALIATVGPRDWADIAVAQAIGGFCGVITGYGWGLAGPAYVARADPRTRALRYAESLRGRALVGIVMLPVGAVVLSLVIDRVALVPILALLTTAAVALSPAWFYVGVARPWTLIVIDTIPRVMGTALGILLLHLGLPTGFAFVSQLTGIGVGLVVATLTIRRQAGGARISVSWPRTLSVLRDQSHGMVAAGASASFAALPVILVGLIAPAALPVYAVFDKVQRQFASAVSPVVQMSQGYVARAAPADRAKAVRRVTLVTGVLSLSGMALFAVIGGWFLHLLVAQTITFTLVEVGILGVALGLILFEQVFGHAVLATAGRMKPLAAATSVGAVVGLLLVSLGAASSGALVALVGFEVGLGVTIVLEVVTDARAERTARRPRNAAHDVELTN
ncbi:hypothetical protein ITJ54_09695 [Curtobacterium sp. VKM Ac-2865]|uniref:hypothetical protein n=1 Tax=Curtobacterium sp. VKM Ac-2865 TaxID=2783817 RepID=UPI00188A1121|nr:hypothetical protein [Curtobacterium sp. VKM Ac-2865]MBF4582939.1 hypothetical protein [Curtobacterium sp. VKM Ac-2865]